eukprot:TRINITY_DN671_c2_g1_i3.p1 TRINITY_DN671_c2_g1~~TRINITY_DN671_c2_g1_i3.p1  ORF type:complete len:298 (+),score=38.12 TRINITY_DN671_c2_g1_i3:96-989(+)
MRSVLEETQLIYKFFRILNMNSQLNTIKPLTVQACQNQSQCQKVFFRSKSFANQMQFQGSKQVQFNRRQKFSKNAESIESGDGGGLGGGGGGANKKFKTGEEENPGGNGFLGGLWTAYLQLLDKQPLITKVWTCALLNGLGDSICQLFIENTDFDFRRLVTFTLLGAVLVAPGLHYWYTALNQIISKPGLVPGIQRMILDQFLWAPFFVGLFISSLMTVQALPSLIKIDDISAKLRQDWFGTVKLNWTLWVPAQTLNFWLVPPNLQVLVANITAIIWNVILSYTAHRKVEVKEAKRY